MDLPCTGIGIQDKWVFLVEFRYFILRIIGNFHLQTGVNWIDCLPLTVIPIFWGWLHQVKSNIEEIMSILVGWNRYTFMGITEKLMIKLMYWGQITEKC